MKQYNILIVDDDEPIRLQYKRILGSEGYTLIFAKNQSDAYEKIKKFSVELDQEVSDKQKVLALAILDQNLEDYDKDLHDPEWKTAGGLNLIQEVKSLFRPTRVIMITAYRWKEGEDRAFEAGRLKADGYLAKTEVLSTEPLKHRVRQELQKFDRAFNNYNRKISRK